MNNNLKEIKIHISSKIITGKQRRMVRDTHWVQVSQWGQVTQIQEKIDMVSKNIRQK